MASQGKEKDDICLLSGQRKQIYHFSPRSQNLSYFSIKFHIYKIQTKTQTLCVNSDFFIFMLIVAFTRLHLVHEGT